MKKRSSEPAMDQPVRVRELTDAISSWTGGATSARDSEGDRATKRVNDTPSPSSAQYDRRFKVGDPIPVTLSKQELAGGLGYTIGQIDIFRRLKNHPAIKQLD